MNIRRISINNDDRRRLLKLVDEAAEDFDNKTYSDTELSAMEVELSAKLGHYMQAPKRGRHLFPSKASRTTVSWWGGLGVTAVAALSLFLVYSSKHTEEDFFLSKGLGDYDSLPCEMTFHQACPNHSEAMHSEHITGDSIAGFKGIPAFLSISCHYEARLHYKVISRHQGAEDYTMLVGPLRQVLRSDKQPLAIDLAEIYEIQFQLAEVRWSLGLRSENDVPSSCW